MMPPLAAAMASWLAMPICAAAEEASTIDPPCSRMVGAAARTTANAEVRLVAIVSWNSSGVVRWAGFSSTDPARFATPSSRPCRATTSSIVVPTAAMSRASTVWLVPPISSASASRASGSRPATATVAPAAPSRRAVAAPAAPVAPMMRWTGEAAMTGSLLGGTQRQQFVSMPGDGSACRRGQDRFDAGVTAHPGPQIPGLAPVRVGPRDLVLRAWPAVVPQPPRLTEVVGQRQVPDRVGPLVGIPQDRAGELAEAGQGRLDARGQGPARMGDMEVDTRASETALPLPGEA